jgi:sigma-E factor negative regulatory protein RseA
MNDEERESQLSAMFDNDLPEAECELLARRLGREQALKARWGRYALIGAAVRAERGVRLDADIASRVSAVLAAEPALEAVESAAGPAAAPRKRAMRWWQPAAGVGIAASVAVASILLLRGPDNPAAPVPVAGGPMASLEAPIAGSAEPESYVVPAFTERTVVMPAAELANYVVAHSEFSSPLTRRSQLSALLATESGTAAAAELSDGERNEAAGAR